MTRVFAIIPAAGVGSRMKADCPKQYLPIDASGTPMLKATVNRLQAVAEIDEIFVTVSDGDPYIESIDLGNAHILKAGGAQRADTVLNSLNAIADIAKDDDLVLVHDAARPLVEPMDVVKLIAETCRVLVNGSAAGAVLAVPVADTVKRVDGEGILTEDIDRNGLVRVATPQCFAYGTLKAALEAHPDVTDESSAVRAAGGKVKVVESSPMNFKVTRPQDLDMVKQLGNQNMKLRIGYGYDSHRLEAGRKFILGGVEIPHTLGLAGHSDADALLHAITDAILGAAHCGNIGMLFPDNDMQFKNADSAVLLKAAWDKVLTTGNWEIQNIDCVVVAQKPKLNPHVQAMTQRIAEILGLEPDQVSVKPKTNEKLGFEGREEGVSVQGVALLAKL